MKTDWLEIGSIVAPQGLEGEVRVYPNSDFPERFVEPGQRWIRRQETEEPQPIELIKGRYVPGKSLYIVQLAGVKNREQAEALRGCQLLVPESDRPELGKDEYHVLDLLGLEVFNQFTGEMVGTVVDILVAGNDLLQVQLKQSPETPIPAVEPASSEATEIHPSTRRGGRKRQREAKLSRRESPKPAAPGTILIPFVNDIVPVVDLANRRLEITPPLGLLESM